MPLEEPAYCRPAAYAAFRREVAVLHEPDGLLRAAVALSLHTRADDSIDEVVAAIEKLATLVRRRLQSDSPHAALAHLHDVLFDVVGFRGADQEDYYDPANSYLGAVLATRRGIPITLSLIYRSVAIRLGLEVEGVNAPGHFLVSVTCWEGRREVVQYVDPFYGGALLSRNEAVERIEAVTGLAVAPGQDPLMIATPAAWLSRMLLNLQAIFARTQQERDLLAMQELQALLAV